MNAAIIDGIIAKKKVCYFISPHFDDMVFSSGALATKLAKTNKIIVINIFTTAGEQHTLSAKAYLKQCKYKNATKLYEDRTKEDKRALQPIAKQVINLGFAEALWRRKPGILRQLLGNVLPELVSVYPTYRFHIIKGRVAKADRRTVAAIEEKLKALVATQNAVVFCPLGVGNHIDHVFTHQLCERLFKDPIYWADYPYTQSSNATPKNKKHFSFADNMHEKAALIAEYKTQYQAIFGASGLVLESERFYTN